MAFRSSRNALSVAAAVGGMWLFAAEPAWGQWEQAYKITAGDAEEGNWFGHSVAIGRRIAVIGAPRDNDAGDQSGSAYVFDLTTGGQVHKLIAGDTAECDRFGGSVSVSGNLAIIGAYGDDHHGESSGSAYVFDVVTGQQLIKLTAADAEPLDYFGFSVSISGHLAVVGAIWENQAGDQAGSAYVFDVATGDQIHKLIADDAEAEDWFGCSVAMSGDLIIVGAYGNDDAGSNSGSAYLFDVVTGEQIHKLTADDAAGEDAFGISVAIDGDIAVVGAACDDDTAGSSGSVYVFDAATAQQLHKLRAEDAAKDDWFGQSVAASGDIAAVGAPGDDDAGQWSGSAYLFNLVTGQQMEKLVADDAAPEDFFGISAAIFGDVVIIGADWDDDAGSDSGSAYVFGDAPPCVADLDDDNVVDLADLMCVIANWGMCEIPGDCPWDLAGPSNEPPDGEVNIDDVFAVLAAWGPCP